MNKPAVSAILHMARQLMSQALIYILEMYF